MQSHLKSIDVKKSGQNLVDGVQFTGPVNSYEFIRITLAETPTLFHPIS